MFAVLTHHGIDPIVGAILVLVAALVAEHYGRRALARGLMAGTALVLTAFVLLPVDAMLAKPLEDRYARPPLPAHVDGIVVLSGGLRVGIFATRGAPSDNSSVMRLIAGAALARRYPGARLIFSGATGGYGSSQAAEIAAAETMLRDLGVAPGRTIYESRSHDTWENLVYSRQLARPRPGETWLLVTSALHMPRAMGSARALGWKMTPWPSDYDTAARLEAQPLDLPSRSIQIATFALHEWLGLIAYKLEGKLD